MARSAPTLAKLARPVAAALVARPRLRRRVLLALDGIGRFRESRGDHEGALGRHAEAAALYQRCRLVLGAKLGVEPSPETRALLAGVRPGQGRALSPRPVRARPEAPIKNSTIPTITGVQ